MPHWEPDFDVYFAMVDDMPATFLVDLAAGRNAPVETHDTRVQVRVTIQQPDEDGMCTREELEALGTVEDAMVAFLEERFDAIHVGHMISDGAMYVVAYASGEAVGEPEQVFDDFDPGDYEIGWIVEHDPEWGMLIEFMYPDTYAMQVIQNRRLLNVRAEHGDDPTLTHAVDHAARFETQAQAEAAAEDLRKAGFTIDSVAANDDGSGWSVCFQRDERLDGDRPDAFCVEILDLLAAHEGNYDGWGAMIMRSPLAN
jgi:uncharacterized protein (TIGR01619 family)